VVVCGCSRPSADEHVSKGDTYASQSMLREASIEYRSALQIDPNRGDVRLKLADVFMKLREPQSALGEYVRAADLRPDDATAQIKAGNLLLVAGRFEDAKARADKAIALDAKSAEAQILLGNALAGLKDLDGAIAEYQEALALHPDEEQAYRNIGALQLARGKTADAEAAFRKAVDVAPKSVPVRMALANFLWAVRRPADAEQVLKEALALDPKDVAVNRALGVFYLTSNQAAAAEPYFKTIAETAKTNDALLTLADYYVFSRRYDDARHILKELAAKKDAFGVSTLRLAALDLLDGNRALASAKVHDVLTANPGDMAARLLNARLLLADGKQEEALAVAGSIVKDDAEAPQAADAHELAGRIQASLDRPEDAIKEYREVLKRKPKPVAAHLALGQLFLARGDVDQAQSHVNEALVIAPNLPDAHAELIRVLVAKGDKARAAAEVATLQKQFPNAPAVLKLAGAQQLAAGQIAGARASYTKALQAQPHDLEAVGGLVAADLSERRVKDAVARIEQSVKTIPPSGALFVLASRVYLAAGDTAKGEEMLRKAIETEPSRLQAYSVLGTLYARQNRLPEAEKTFLDLVKRNPNSVSAHTMLGMIYDVQGRTKDAEQKYKDVLVLDPHAPVAANNLAWIYVSNHGDLTEAAQLAKTAQERLPDEPNVNDTLGWIYFQQQRFTDAVRHLETSVKSGFGNPAADYHLGLAYSELGETAKARQALTRAVAFKGDYDGKAEARKALQALSGT
jgi:tetratricopeptide (TPR) repeat protein